MGSFVNRFGSFVSVFLILYLVERGFSIAESGTAVGAYGAGSLGAAAVGGYLADRLGRRNAMALSMFAAASMALLLSQARSLLVITLLTAAFGFASELYRPASAALLTDLVPPQRRLAAFAAYRLAINAGFAFGPAVAGFLAERSFFWLFVGEAVTSAVLGVVALFTLPEGVRTRRGEEPRGEAWRAIRRDRPFQLLWIASLVSGFVYFQSGAALPLQVRAAGYSTAVYGALISLNGALIVLVELPLTAVLRRFAPPRVIALGIAMSGVGFGILAFPPGLPLFVVSAITWTLGEILSAPMGSAYVAGLAPMRLRGRYQGAYGLTFAISLVLAPVVGARLFAWSPAGLWTICGLLALVASALVLRLPARRAPAPAASDAGGPP